MQLCADFGDDLTINLTPAVRKPTGPCIEEDNCDWEKITLCAFDLAGNSTKNKVSFLACMDKREGSATSASKPCAKAINVDQGSLQTCFKGQQGTSLLEVPATPQQSLSPIIQLLDSFTD